MTIELIDLTRFSRTPDDRTRVVIKPDRYGPQEWLVFGQAQLSKHQDYWLLKSYLEDATDFEHDSAYALRLPLIGLTFSMVAYHQTMLEAWIDPDNEDDFNVPNSDYNPYGPEVERCDRCPEHHLFVQEGFYVPPFNPELYKAVRGKKVEITIGKAG